MILNACLEIKAQKTLDEVAEIVSGKIFGGVRFVGKEEFIRDEIPAIYTERDILGMRIILLGNPELDGCHLQMETRRIPGIILTAEENRRLRVSISHYVADLLQGIDGLAVTVVKEES